MLFDYTIIMNQCAICLRLARNGETLCEPHRKVYVFDKALDGYRLKKRKNGTATRHIQKKFHKHEISLTKIIERFYGSSEVLTGFHPRWAVSKRGALLEFDIIIPSRRLLIEYNGEQHYNFIAWFHKTKERFNEQKKRDDLKSKLAEVNNYSLIIFKYDEPLFEDYVINKIEEHLKCTTH